MSRSRGRYRIGDTTSIITAFEKARMDYDIAKDSRFRRTLSGVSSMGSGADFHFRNERQHLQIMELARDFDRNDIAVGQGVTRVLDNVLQSGPRLNPDTGNDGVDARLKSLWREWSEDADACHSSGELIFHDIARLSLRSAIVDGDVFMLLLNTGRIEAIEAHRVRTPKSTRKNVVLGVLLDANRVRKEFWITREEVAPANTVTKVSEIRAIDVRDKEGHRQILQIYMPRRFSQTRGVSAFAPISDAVGMHGDIQFAKLVQQQVVSCWAIIRERELGFNNPNEPAAVGSESQVTVNDGSSFTEEEIAPGMEYTGAPGEKLTGFSPNVPNPEFFDHVTLILTLISVNLGLPLAVLLLDPRNTNFSGWRGAMDQARQGFQALNRHMVMQFYRPMYRWKVREWIRTDPFLQRRAKSTDFFNHSWSEPFWPYIEPMKDASADAKIVANNLNSRRRVLGRRGLDIDTVDIEIIADGKRFIEAAIAAADEINASTPKAEVNWREIAFDNTDTRQFKVMQEIPATEIPEEGGDNDENQNESA